MFIKNIKQRYFQNLLDSYIKNNDTDSIKKILKSKFITNKNLNFDDFMNYINLFASQQKFENLFTKNLIWINSFDKEDYSYVNNFLNDFLKSQNINFNKTEEYIQKLNEIRKTYSLQKINFDDLCKYSYAYQYLISEQDTDKFTLINSSSAFFETQNNFYFTHYFLTKAYIYISRNPYSLLKKYKYLNGDKPNVNNMQGLLNGDHNCLKHNLENEENYVEENIQSWSTNNSSWSNLNVINTFRGLVVNYKTLQNNTTDALSQVLSHLIQSGIKISLDYDFVENFVNNNPFPQDNYGETSISNNERKLLDRDNSKVMSLLNHK